jgi:NADPH:quinone reductase-like Zn-dependent oxidoreductase
MDLMQREGKYNVPPQAGKTLGVEFSGWVEELGTGDISGFKVGDEVFGLAYGGESLLRLMDCADWKQERMLNIWRLQPRC